ncbi:uncharacterized protein CEXT_548661 [Caerostris extrusa]|uniref:Uncharacterized protein n=1 Tax=Caerostris extrusa TaxID=172846 RepID=A0AAV4NZP3_CAEEX|nr:uncharacterized protein CEXT_548661 [Caerostris extrusa]
MSKLQLPRRSPTLQCSMPKCDPGCTIDYSTKPCPGCSCGGEGGVQCSTPKCDPGCTVDHSVKPCPTCACGDSTPAWQCSPVKCESHCQQVLGPQGCPTCKCPSCTPPRCAEGCWVDTSAKPCPTCICDRHQRRYAVQLNVFSDPFCRTLKCGPRCERALAPSSPTERCPMCLCKGRAGQQLTCAAMRCELPCRFERFSEHGCPSCICNPIPCPEIFCPPGQAPVKSAWQRCPVCQPIEFEGPPAIQCSMPKCDPGCTIDYSTKPCPGCSCLGPPLCSARCPNAIPAAPSTTPRSPVPAAPAPQVFLKFSVAFRDVMPAAPSTRPRSPAPPASVQIFLKFSVACPGAMPVASSTRQRSPVPPASAQAHEICPELAMAMILISGNEPFSLLRKKKHHLLKELSVFLPKHRTK